MTEHPYAASFVRRWHSNPDLAHIHDTLGEHHGRAGLLVIMLWPDHSHDLLKAAITHDLGEVVTGDLSATFKAARPDIAQAAQDIENDYLRTWGLLFPLTDLDKARLKFVDRLDAYWRANRAQPHLMNGKGWPEARQWLFTEQERLVSPGMRVTL